MSDLLILTGEKWVQNGFVLAHDPASGAPVFLHGAIPGERVEARIIRTRSTHRFARVERVLEASPERIESDCTVFPLCGGCSFRHIPYNEELRLKRALLTELPHLEECLELTASARPAAGGDPEAGRESTTSAKLTKTGNPVVAGNPEGYRNHVQVHFDSRGQAGFFSLHSNTVVPFPDEGCRHLSPELNGLIREYAKRHAASPPAPARSNGQANSGRNGNEINRDSGRGENRNPEKRIVFRQSFERLCSPEDLKTTRYIRERLDGSPSLLWSFPSDGFFQNNRFLLPLWLKALREQIPAGSPDTMELFCGSGIIGGFVRDLLGSYRGYELAKEPVKAARWNFREKGMEGECTVQDLYRHAPDPGEASLLILNPPRAGMNESMVRSLHGSRIRTILYSSCNPHTLNRDLGLLFREGFLPQFSQIFDFFPRTPHMEVVVKLAR